MEKDVAVVVKDNWVQCSSCQKWRKAPLDVDVESLSDDWHCALNYWNMGTANCSVEEESDEADIPEAVVGEAIDMRAPENEPEVPEERPFEQIYSTKNWTISVDQRNYFNQFCHHEKVENWTKAQLEELIQKMMVNKRFADLAKTPSDLKSKLKRQLSNYMEGYHKSLGIADRLLESAKSLCDVKGTYIVFGVDNIIEQWVTNWEEASPGLEFLPVHLRRFLFEFRCKVLEAYDDGDDRCRRSDHLPQPLLSGKYGIYEMHMRVYVVLFLNRFYTNTINQHVNDVAKNNVFEVKEHLHLCALETNLVVMVREQLDSDNSLLLTGFKELSWWVDLVEEIKPMDLYTEEQNNKIDKGGMPFWMNDLKEGNTLPFMKVLFSSLECTCYDFFADYLHLHGTLPNGTNTLSGALEEIVLTNENLACISYIGGHGLLICSELIYQQKCGSAQKKLFWDNIKEMLYYVSIDQCEYDVDNKIDSTTISLFKYRLDEDIHHTNIPLPRTRMVECLKMFELEVVIPIYNSPGEMITIGTSFGAYLQDKINGCEGITTFRNFVYVMVEDNVEMMANEKTFMDFAEIFVSRFCQYLCKVTLGDLKRYKERLVRDDFCRIPYSSFRHTVYEEGK